MINGNRTKDQTIEKFNTLPSFSKLIGIPTTDQMHSNLYSWLPPKESSLVIYNVALNVIKYPFEDVLLMPQSHVITRLLLSLPNQQMKGKFNIGENIK